MSEHPVLSEEMAEIVESFVVETQEIFDELHEDLLQLEEAEERAHLIDKVFRAVHTVKGTSSFLNLEQLNTLAHHFEDVLNRVRKGDVPFRREMMDVLFAAFDRMSELLDQVLNRELSPLPIDELIDDLKGLCTADAGGDGVATEPVLKEPAGVPRDPHHPAPEAIRGPRRTGSVRVGIDRLDDLMALVSELTASRTALSRIVRDLEHTYGPSEQVVELQEKAGRIEALAGEIRSVIQTTRMVAVERVFSKFPRVARDLGRSLDKDVRVVYRGGETEIDRSIADEVGEALLHLVRNAIDHGIEPRQQRLDVGKPQEGTIMLEAQRRDSFVEISVEDDGRGLDPVAIVRKAVAIGRISAEEASAMSESQIFNLIWEAGLSTTDVANRISGRGVGMDVVRTAVARLGGTCRIRSTRGRGTCFSLILPLAASMTRCLIVELCGQTFALPQHAVTDVVPVPGGHARAPCIEHDGESLVLVQPADILPPSAQPSPDPLAAILTDGQHRCALAVDRLHSQEEVVHSQDAIASRQVRGADALSPVSGSTVLSDGRLVPVLDAERIIRHALDTHVGRDQAGRTTT